MAKDKVFIQRFWIPEFFQPLAVSGSLDATTQANIKVEIYKEVEWVLRNPNFEDDTVIRLDKIQDLLTANEDDITVFDQYYVYRRLFFEWILA